LIAAPREGFSGAQAYGKTKERKQAVLCRPKFPAKGEAQDFSICSVGKLADGRHEEREFPKKAERRLIRSRRHQKGKSVERKRNGEFSVPALERGASNEKHRRTHSRGGGSTGLCNARDRKKTLLSQSHPGLWNEDWLKTQEIVEPSLFLRILPTRPSSKGRGPLEGAMDILQIGSS